MNGAAKRTMPVRLGIRVLARLWLVHMQLRLAAPAESGSCKTLRL